MQGVICGADQRMEHLLPWWWSRYSHSNQFPVTFCDFGMGEGAKKWCKEHGTLMPILPTVVCPQDKIKKTAASLWEKDYGPSLWKARPAWFCKPRACLLSPYKQSIWLDLDCEVTCSLTSLFDHYGKHLCLAREYDTGAYNSGVLVFSHNDPLIALWAEASTHSTQCFSGDQQLLTHLIQTHTFPIEELPEEWNYRLSQGFSFQAKIYHWVGTAGKKYIEETGGIFPSLQKLCGHK